TAWSDRRRRPVADRHPSRPDSPRRWRARRHHARRHRHQPDDHGARHRDTHGNSGPDGSLGRIRQVAGAGAGLTSGTLRSKDGTTIAYEHQGHGPALILVDGALCSRAFGPMKALSAALQSSFTVFRYDRRGRGDSGNTLPYAVEREIEDLGAVIAAAGGS